MDGELCGAVSDKDAVNNIFAIDCGAKTGFLIRFELETSISFCEMDVYGRLTDDELVKLEGEISYVYYFLV